MKRLRRLWALLPVMGLVFSAALGLTLLKPEPARAYDICDGPSYNIAYNRQEYYGYFDNQCAPYGDNVYSGGMDNPFGTGVYVNSPAEFKQIVGNGTASGNAWYRNASRFIVLSMLNYGGGVPRSRVDDSPCPTAAGNYSCLQDWKNRVDAMSSYGTSSGVSRGPNGRIVWHYDALLNCGTVNTYFQNDNGVNNDVAPFIMNTGNSTCGPSNYNDTIAFFDKSGTLRYLLRRSCANPIGDFAGLPRADYNVTVNGFPSTTNNVIQNGTYTMTAQLHNNGPSHSDPGVLQVVYPGSSLVVQPCAPNCTPATQTSLTGGYDSGKGFRTGSAIPYVSGTNWFWDTDSMASGVTTSGTITFKVVPSAPVGAIITFRIYYYPADEQGAVHSDTVTFKVVSARYPTVSGQNGDVHAGGGFCDQSLSTGYVQGHAPTAASTQTSYGQYVVSSAQTVSGITNFRSDGPVGGSTADNLKMGPSGGYAQVCRKDLLTVANNYRSGGGSPITILPGGSAAAPADYDISGWSGVYYVDGNADYHGTVSNKLTIVSTAGNVNITGAGIQLNGATDTGDAHTEPSVGIIAANNINISRSVLQVDAYMFADGAIDTCVEGVSSTTACSTNQLLINGFLMANDINFHRLGVFNTNGAPVTELVRLNPQLYLNPPKFFDASVDDILLEGQGEKQPLF
jgi:hypothetical protein